MAQPAQDLIDLDMLDANAAKIDQEAQSATNLFYFSMQLPATSSGYQPIRQSVETEHRYHPSFGHYSFTPERRTDHYLVPNLFLPNPLFIPAPPASQPSSATFLAMTPSFLIDCSLSSPPRPRLRQLSVANNWPFLPQTNLAATSTVN